MTHIIDHEEGTGFMSGYKLANGKIEITDMIEYEQVLAEVNYSLGTPLTKRAMKEFSRMQKIQDERC